MRGIHHREPKNVGIALALALAAVALTPSLAARAQSNPAATSSIDIPLETSRSAAPIPAPPTRSAPSLSSRSMTDYESGLRQIPAAAPHVLAQLGTVTVAQGAIRIARDPHARPLSIVPKGTNLAVVADGGKWWGVLMVNNTMGYIPKSAIQMVDYQTEITVTPPPATDPNAPADSGTPGDSSDFTPDPSLDARTTSVLKEAFSYLGVPYVWAGTSRNGLDCSGFLCSVFSAALGIHLPRHSGDQARVGKPVTGDDLRPGDRLYFDMGNHGEISHCGIYIGNGLFIHASTNHGQVAVDSLLQPNYRRALVCARRS